MNKAPDILAPLWTNRRVGKVLHDRFRRIRVQPADLLNGAKTLHGGSWVSCDWLKNFWVPAGTYVQWASRMLELDGGSKEGWAAAIAFSKRAACRTIDSLLLYNHQGKMSAANYPEKLVALRAIGIEIPDLVHRLVIEPRNQDEHAYQWPKKQAARDAVELAKLLEKATETIVDRGCIMSYGWNVMSTSLTKDSRSSFTIDGIEGEPMLFVHASHAAGAAMIVDPDRNEIQYCPLSDWDAVEENQLAILLRSQLEMPNRGYTQWPIEHFNNPVLLDALYDQRP